MTRLNCRKCVSGVKTSVLDLNVPQSIGPNTAFGLVSIHLRLRSCRCIMIVLLIFFTSLVTSFMESRSRGVSNVNTSLTGLDRLIQNHRVICRLEDSCDIPDENDLGQNPCCKPCSCEKSCFSERTCCPDVLEGFWEEPEEEIELECLKPAFRIPSESIYHAIDNTFMIVKCPHDFKKKEIIEKCERRNGSTVLQDHIPVTDIEKTLTFANKYCAECHLIREEKLSTWTVTVECQESVFNFKSIDSLLLDINATNDCYLKFEPVAPHHHKKCYAGISACNVTGKWEIYDNFTEQACQLYTAPFLQFNNPFCAICNGYDAHSMTGLDVQDCSNSRRPPIDWVPFSALIKLESLDDQSEGVVKKESCSQNQIYDAFLVSHYEN